jgi:hypothetical protein
MERNTLGFRGKMLAANKKEELSEVRHVVMA